MPGDFGGDDIDPIIAELRQKFIDSALESFAVIERAFGEGAGDPPMEEIARQVHSLKGLAATFGFPLISVIAHRLEDYLSGLSHPNASEARDILVFVDRVQDVLDESPVDDDASKLARGLPVREAGQVEEAAGREALLVMPRDTATAIVERYLRVRGFRVVTVPSTIDDLRVAYRARPDLVMATAVMPELDGIDFSCALRAMPATSYIPVVLVTSFDEADKRFGDLPGDVPVVHKRDGFERELTAALKTLDLG